MIDELNDLLIAESDRVIGVALFGSDENLNKLKRKWPSSIFALSADSRIIRIDTREPINRAALIAIVNAWSSSE